MKRYKVTILLGNAALSLELVECRLFERVPRLLFNFSFSPVRHDSYLRSAPFRLNVIKHSIFERAPRRLLLFDLKDAKDIRGGPFRLRAFFPAVLCQKV